MMNRFKSWTQQNECPRECYARFSRLAVIAAVVAVALIVLWATLPAWGIPADMLPRFQNLFLMFSAAFAFLGGGFLGAAALVKRGIY